MLWIDVMLDALVSDVKQISPSKILLISSPKRGFACAITKAKSCKVFVGLRICRSSPGLRSQNLGIHDTIPILCHGGIKSWTWIALRSCRIAVVLMLWTNER